jgi:hypothetical protein
VSDPANSGIESSLDTSPLDLDQLSDTELEHILAIEQRLAQAKQIEVERSQELEDRFQRQASDKPYLANVEERYARVLLVDGGRGTGKTSLLLTLVRKWHADAGIGKKWADKDDYKQRLLGLPNAELHTRTELVNFVRVIRILDFDPLPPEMPLLAGIIQAMRPLADQFDPPAALTDDPCDEGQPTLAELWYKLFRVAALGWSAIPRPPGLIEQLLAREEQVKDWLQVADNWNSFVWEVLSRGKCLQKPDRLPKEAVFVIMIDDVDLQVTRVQELLPALRLLYHPRVFFIVAADKLHLIDMLKLDFLGRQNQLARHPNAVTDSAIELANRDRWASDLAHASFQKVFPKRNRWKLYWLSVLQFLAFPGQPAGPLAASARGSSRRSDVDSSGQSDAPKSFFEYLKEIVPKEGKVLPVASTATSYKGRSKKSATKQRPSNAGELILRFAHLANEVGFPGVMPYRAAAHLSQYVAGLNRRAPTEVLARLLSHDIDDRSAVVLHDTMQIRVTLVGELAALYPPALTVLAGSYNSIFSWQPDFVFHAPRDKSAIRMSTAPESGFNFTGALIANMLQEQREQKYPVEATGLQWNTYLSLAWTEWPSLGASFAWTRHIHPTPDELLEQTQAWAKMLSDPPKHEHNLEWYAYAWIYSQRLWSGHDCSKIKEPANLLSADAVLPWKELLDLSGIKDIKEKKRWISETLPLLARPELGFPPDVQKILLRGLQKKSKPDLRRIRRRLATDAIVAMAMQQRSEVLTPLPKDDEIETALRTIDQIYSEGHDSQNMWQQEIESSKSTQDSAPSNKGQ